MQYTLGKRQNVSELGIGEGAVGVATANKAVIVQFFVNIHVRIRPGACMSVSSEGYVLSGRGLCHGPIIRAEESYRVWCV